MPTECRLRVSQVPDECQPSTGQGSAECQPAIGDSRVGAGGARAPSRSVLRSRRARCSRRRRWRLAWRAPTAPRGSRSGLHLRQCTLRCARPPARRTWGGACPARGEGVRLRGPRLGWWWRAWAPDPCLISRPAHLGEDGIVELHSPLVELLFMINHHQHVQERVSEAEELRARWRRSHLRQEFGRVGDTAAIAGYRGLGVLGAPGDPVARSGAYARGATRAQSRRDRAISFVLRSARSGQVSFVGLRHAVGGGRADDAEFRGGRWRGPVAAARRLLRPTAAHGFVIHRHGHGAGRKSGQGGTASIRRLALRRRRCSSQLGWCDVRRLASKCVATASRDSAPRRPRQMAAHVGAFEAHSVWRSLRDRWRFGSSAPKAGSLAAQEAAAQRRLAELAPQLSAARQARLLRLECEHTDATVRLCRARAELARAMKAAAPGVRGGDLACAPQSVGALSAAVAELSELVAARLAAVEVAAVEAAALRERRYREEALRDVLSRARPVFDDGRVRLHARSCRPGVSAALALAARRRPSARRVVLDRRGSSPVGS